VLKIVLNFAQDPFYSKINWEILCHPLIFSKLSSKLLPTNIHLNSSVSVQKFQKILSQSNAFFITPTHPSIEQASFYRVPVILLPEQNGLSPAQFINLKKKDFPTELNLTITCNLQNGLISYGEMDWNKMYSDTSDFLNSPKGKKALKQVAQKLKEILLNKDEFNKLVRKQYEAMKSSGGFDGAEKIAGEILNFYPSLPFVNRPL
jgi:hypothetical protein